MLGHSFQIVHNIPPQTDVQTERINRVLQDMIRHYVSPTHNNGDQYFAVARVCCQ